MRSRSVSIHSLRTAACNNKVTVYLTSQAPVIGLREFNVRRGDEVTIILTNLDQG